MTYVVEVLTGRSYWDVLDEFIFKNLDMSASSDYIQLRDSGGDISQGWLRQDVNLTSCIAAYEAAASSNSSDAAAAEVVPAACLGVAEGIEFWTEGRGQEWGAGGNVIASGNDLVSTTFAYICSILSLTFSSSSGSKKSPCRPSSPPQCLRLSKHQLFPVRQA